MKFHKSNISKWKFHFDKSSNNKEVQQQIFASIYFIQKGLNYGKKRLKYIRTDFSQLV